MKKSLWPVFILLVSSLFLSSCVLNVDEESDGMSESSITVPLPEFYFEAVILSVRPGDILVEPLEDFDERNCSDQISVGYVSAPSDLMTGDIVGIHYNGVIEEIYPANINNSYIDLISKSEEKHEMPVQYMELIDSYVDAINRGEDRSGNALSQIPYSEINDSSFTDIYICGLNAYNNPLQDFGYALFDADNNGIPELLISSTDSTVDKIIYAMYTIDESGNLIRLFYSTADKSYHIYPAAAVIMDWAESTSRICEVGYLIDGSSVIYEGRLDRFISTTLGEECYAFFPDEECPVTFNEGGEVWPYDVYIVDEEFVSIFHDLRMPLDISYTSFTGDY